MTRLVNLRNHLFDEETPEIVLKFLSMIGTEEYTCDVDTSVKFVAEPHMLGKTRTNIGDMLARYYCLTTCDIQRSVIDALALGFC